MRFEINSSERLLFHVGESEEKSCEKNEWKLVIVHWLFNGSDLPLVPLMRYDHTRGMTSLTRGVLTRGK